MSQRLSVNNFEWREEASQFNENLIRNYDEESDIFLNLILSTYKNYKNFKWTYHFYLKERYLKKSKSLLLIYMIKMNRLTLKKSLWSN